MKKRTPPLLLVSILSAVLLPLMTVDAPAQVTPEALVVVDPLGVGFEGVMFLVDPVTGDRAAFSNFTDPAQGILLGSENDVAVAPSGLIYLTSERFVVRVNPLTGNRTLVSDLENTDQGPTGEFALGITVDSTGQIYVTDATDQLFSVDPATGNRSLVSVLDDAGNGIAVTRGERLLLESDTSMLILDRGGERIAHLDLTTGFKTLVASFGNNSVYDFAREPSGDIVVVTLTGQLLFRVFRATGNHIVLSDFRDLAQGPQGRVLEGVTVNSAGEIFVVDSQAEESLLREGAVFSVDPVSGQRQILSDFSDDTQGPKGFKPGPVALAVAVSPTPQDVKLVRTVLLATDNINAKKDAVVRSGNMIVNEPSGQMVLNKGVMTPENFEVSASSLTIKREVVVGGDVLVDNRFKNKGTVLGMEDIGEFPVFEALPPLNLAVPGDAKVLVKKNGTQILQAGRYKTINVKKFGTLILTGGIYEAETLKTGKRSQVFYEAPVEIRLSKGASFGKASTFGPPEGSFLDAKAAVLYSQGNVKGGTASELQVNLIAPDNDCAFGKSSQLTGSAYCRKISLGKAAEAMVRSFLEDSVVTGD